MEGGMDDYGDVSNVSIVAGPNVSEAGDGTLSDGYCGPTWLAIGMAYGSAHGFVSLIVCFVGCGANLLNLIVLTRRDMINPTNVLLTGLAMADLLNEVEYMPFALFMRTLKKPPMTYPWALFVLAHSNFSQVCHTISIWLTVTLAVWRYIMVAMPMRNKTLCTMERAKWAVGIAYFSSLIVCIPAYLSFSIKATFPKAPTPSPIIVTSGPTAASLINGTLEEVGSSTNSSLIPKYSVYYSALALEHDQFLVKANFWIYSVVIKIIPCIVLTVVSLRLINSLMEAKRRKDMLLSKRPSAAGGHQEDSGSDRTTRMLLAVLLLFLITEFPQGILGLLSGILGETFFRSCYMPLGDLMDIIAILNSAINFILYCSMSKKFRETFVQVFHLSRILQPAPRTTSVPTASTTVVTSNNATVRPDTNLLSNGNSQYTSV